MISRPRFFGGAKYKAISGPLTLNHREARGYTIKATGAQNVILPDARTLPTGGPLFFIFNYTGGGPLQIKAADGTNVGGAINPGTVFELYLIDNTTITGVWIGRARTIGTGSGTMVRQRLWIAGGNGLNTSLSIYTPNPAAWAAGATAPNAKLEAAGMALGCRTFIVGRSPATAGVSNMVDEINSNTGAWTNRANLPFNAAKTCGIGSKRWGYVVIFGGDATANVYQGTPFGGATNPGSSAFLMWAGRRALPILKSRCTAVYFEGLDRAIILGGDPVPTPNLAHNVGLDTYWTITNMPTAFRHSMASFQINGLVYACGGRSESPVTRYQNVDEYNPLTDAWTSRAPLLTGARYGGAGISGNAKGYYCGGQDNVDAPVITAHGYEKDTWIGITSMNVARALCANHGTAMQ